MYTCLPWWHRSRTHTITLRPQASAPGILRGGSGTSDRMRHKPVDRWWKTRLPGAETFRLTTPQPSMDLNWEGRKPEVVLGFQRSFGLKLAFTNSEKQVFLFPLINQSSGVVLGVLSRHLIRFFPHVGGLMYCAAYCKLQWEGLLFDQARD